MKTKQKLLGLCIAFLMLCAINPASAIVINPGFEDQTGCGLFNQCTGAPPWIFTGAGAAGYGAFANTGNGFAILATTPGDDTVNGTGPGTASQTVVVPTAGLYEFSFFYRVAFPSAFSLSASVGGNTLFNTGVSNTSWTEVTALVNLAAGANAILFSASPGAGSPSYLGLDDVNLIGVPGPIAGAGLPGLILACGGLLAWYRRRQSATQIAA